MQIILIGILAFTVVAVLEALVHTLRFVTDKRKDELKRRLSSLGTSEGRGRSPACCARESSRRSPRSTLSCARSS